MSISCNMTEQPINSVNFVYDDGSAEQSLVGSDVSDAFEEVLLTVVAFLVVYIIGSWFRSNGWLQSPGTRKSASTNRKLKVGTQVPVPQRPVAHRTTECGVGNKETEAGRSATLSPSGVTSRSHGYSVNPMLDEQMASSESVPIRANSMPVNSLSADSTRSTPLARRMGKSQSCRDPHTAGASLRPNFPGRIPRTPSDGNVTAHDRRLAAARRSGLPATTAGVEDGACDAHTGRQFLISLRICAARRQFREGLANYDAASDSIDTNCKRCANTWSLLLYCAVEAGEYERCHRFYQLLCGAAKPSTDDFVNMVRCYVSRKDCQGLTKFLDKLQEQGSLPDVVARNRALSACCSGKNIEMAECILQKLSDVPMEIIAYNTMIKGYASLGNADKCFELYETLLGGGIAPSVMTYGILLDACIGVANLSKVKRVFWDLRASEVEPNVVHYTAYIRCLVSAGLLKEAQDTLQEMESNSAITPDLVTFSTLVKAFADRGHIADSMRVIERMVAQGVEPDSVVFNTLLTGCCVEPMATSQIMHIFSRLIEQGLKPSSATLSILVKAFATTESWQVCLQLLENSPARFGLEPELWIFAQVAQACVRAGGGPEVAHAFLAMVRAAARRGEAIDKPLSTRMQRLCTSCGIGAQGSMLHRAVMSAAGRLNTADVDKLASDLAL